MGNLAQFNLHSSPSRIEFNEIDAQLATNIEGYLHDWFPDRPIKQSVGWYCIGNKGALKINATDGHWRDHGGDDKGPGLLSLYAWQFNIDVNEAASRLSNGVSTPLPKRVTKPRPKPAPEYVKATTTPDFNHESFADVKRGNKGWYEYRDASGELIGFVKRIVKSDGSKMTPPISWCRKVGDDFDAWHYKKAGIWDDEYPIYGAEKLAQFPEKLVCIVEGEKCADDLNQRSDKYLALAWCGGAGRASDVDWSLLKNRDVTIWPDADEDGTKARDAILEQLPEARVCDVSSFDKGDDCADYVGDVDAFIDAGKAVVDTAGDDFDAMLDAMTISDDERITELEKYAQDAAFVLPGIALRGEITYLNAQYNTGKTLLAIWLLCNRDMIATKGMRICYVNADDSYNGGLEKTKLTKDHGIDMYVPNQYGFTVEKLNDIMEGAVKVGRARNLVVVLDTLKKFVNPMDKNDAKRFGDNTRSFTQAGGTLIALAHTNKNKDSDGKSIAEGVNDFLSDADCAYTIELAPIITEGSQKTVVFENKKLRGPVKQKVTFQYDAGENVTWAQRLESIRRIDDKEAKANAEAAEKAAQLEKDKSIVEYIKSRLAGGAVSRTSLIKDDSGEAGSRDQRAKVIDRYRGQFWDASNNKTGGTSYHLPIGQDSPPQSMKQEVPWD